jgi:hypothetical protein
MQKKFQKNKKQNWGSLRSCKIPNIHRAGRPQKLSPEQRRQIGMIIKRLTLRGKSGCTYLQRI